MALDAEILSDFHQLLGEHGVRAHWKGLDLLVLVSRVRREQQIDLGGLVESPDLSLRAPKSSFPAELPKFGELVELEGESYRIVQVSRHPRSPLITLELASPHE